MTEQLETELQEQETNAIMAFRKDFHELCEKHGIEGILIGLRPEIKKIEGKEGKSAIPAFLDFNISNLNPNKLETLMKLYGELGDELEEKAKRKAFSLLEKIANALEKDDKKESTEEKSE